MPHFMIAYRANKIYRRLQKALDVIFKYHNGVVERRKKLRPCYFQEDDY